MSFSRKYPISNFYYDPAIQPSKPIARLAVSDEQRFNRQIPQGRYDTTYRREFLNFKNGVNTESGNPVELEKYSNKQENPNDKSNLNPFTMLPPIGAETARMQQNQSNQQTNPNQFNHPPPQHQQNSFTNAPQQSFTIPSGMSSTMSANSDYLPIEPIRLSAQEEKSLMEDVQREFQNANSNQIKQFYQEISQHDQRMSGFVHHHSINEAVMNANLPINESLLRFIMSKYVSASQERGHVNYNELVKFFGQCIQDSAPYQQQQNQNNQMQYNNMQQQNQQVQSNNQQQYQNETARGNSTEEYDPDEQAILRLMHENMREWDQVNLINVDNLRKKFYEADRNQTQILGQSEIEDVLYRNRIPIQRSLIFSILEKYCKVTSGRYRWPSFVDFLEKLHHMKLPNRKKTDYTIHHDEKDNVAEKFTYRIQQLDTLKSKSSEEERIQEINKQITNLKSMKPDIQQRIGSSLSSYIKGESWFTRFMRLANAIYTHRGSNYIEFSLQKEEARNLVKAYNSVFELNITNNVLEEGLNRSMKGPNTNVVIDDLLKNLSSLNLTMV